MRVLLVEPYYSGSHRAWADGYVRHSSHDVRLITHPGRWWKWRMRGAAVTLAASLESLEDWRPDVVLVSDMIDLAHFRMLARRRIGDPPTALYFHESQLTYPVAPGSSPDHSYSLTNWISACAADAVLFNSGYHRQIFFETLGGLLATFPDMGHGHLIHDVESRSEVMPVGVDLSWVAPRTATKGIPRVLWNHRWEHDKDPEAFAEAVEHLLRIGVDFELVLAGPRPGRSPAALERIRELAGDRIVHDGEAPTPTYRKLVAGSDIVASASRQEFFGISIVEAIASGCRPVLPDRLSYPWLIPDEFHDEVLYPEGELGPALARALERPLAPEPLAEAMMRFDWTEVAPAYDSRLETLRGLRRPASGEETEPLAP